MAEICLVNTVYVNLMQEKWIVNKMIKTNFDFFDFTPTQFSTFLPLPLTHVRTCKRPHTRYPYICTQALTHLSSQHSRAHTHTFVTYPVDSDDTKAEAVGVERVDEGGGGDGAGDDYLHDVVEFDGKQVVTLTPVTDTVVTQVRSVTYVTLQLNREVHHIW